jgi:hypothetical protein
VNALIPESKPIGDIEVPIREHCGTEFVSLVPLGQFVWRVCTHRQNLHISRIKLGPEFFPSP